MGSLTEPNVATHPATSVGRTVWTAFRRLPRGTRALAVIFGVSGVAHLVVPRVYEAIVPRWVPQQRAVVYASGVAELAAAAGLAGARAWGGPLAFATLLGVWPANVQMALDAEGTARRVGLWTRVPLQVPMLAWAWRAGRDRRR